MTTGGYQRQCYLLSQLQLQQDGSPPGAAKAAVSLLKDTSAAADDDDRRRDTVESLYITPVNGFIKPLRNEKVPPDI